MWSDLDPGMGFWKHGWLIGYLECGTEIYRIEKFALISDTCGLPEWRQALTAEHSGSVISRME